MINFILPNSFCDVDNNLKLIEKNNYSNLFYGVEGNFAFSIYTGRANNNLGNDFMAYIDIVRSVELYQEISENMTIIDFSNTLLEETDYEDAMGEVILDEFADKDNVFFELSDIDFIDFLVNKYPKIQIILHENYTIFHSEEDIQNVIEKYPNIKGINITILNLCQNINIKKIGVLNLDSCFYCPQYPLCLKREHRNILRYRKASSFNDCSRKKLIVLDNIIENLSILLKETNVILFGNITDNHLVDYLELIESILEEEKKGNIPNEVL